MPITMKQRKVLFILFLVQAMMEPSVDAAAVIEDTFKEADNRSVNLLSPIRSWAETSVIQCGKYCTDEHWCGSFSWDSSHGHCTIGYGVISSNTTLSDTRTLYVKPGPRHKSCCPHGAGYEARSDGTEARCVHLSTDQVTYLEARDRCRGQGVGARLFKADSKAWIETVADMAEERGLPSYATVYIGLDDIQTEGMYIWSDGKRMIWDDRKLFENGEPSALGGHDCVGVRRISKVLWDNKCNDAHFYSCEIPYS